MKILSYRSPHLCKGRQAENHALAYLEAQGLVLVERNFRCKQGEIDLIFRENTKTHAELVFVEVRFRNKPRSAQRVACAVESISFAKQQRLIHAAQFFLLRFPQPPACRFDVVAIDHTQMEWIKNAISS